MPLRAYRPDPQNHDDLFAPDRSLRPEWGAFGPRLTAAVEEGLLVRWQQQAERALLSAGAGHLAADLSDLSDLTDLTDPNGTAADLRGRHADVSFRFDPIPVIIDHAAWLHLETGLIQRAQLYEALLSDLYGARRVIESAVLPAGALLGAPHYLRPAVGMSVAKWIVRMASDVVRDATGRFVVLSDHTDVPVGVGYGLAYRSVSARLVPDALREASVVGATRWLTFLREAIASVAPPGRDNPRTVVLASVGSARFVDHSLLATQLGYHLAEDLDMAVSGGRLVLRSLDGLEGIDILLRCTEDASTDPLEIAGSVGGVPGLLALARRGRVGVANAIGSGVAGHLALQAFLPALCEFLLGERLRLPNPETLWCGDREHRSAVLEDLDGWVLHDTDPSAGASVGAEPASVFGGSLSDADAADWSRRIAEQPHRFVAQRKLVLGTSPVVDGSSVRPGVVALRLFSANGPGGLRVLPGGIGRVMQSDRPVVTQASAVGKDVWVRGPDAATQRSGAVHMSTVRLDDGIAAVLLPQVDLGASIPIRAAETLFWIGRNAERADTIARLVGVVLNRLQQDPWTIGFGEGRLAEVMTLALQTVSGRTSPAHTRSMNDSSSRPPNPGSADFASFEAILRDALSGALGDRPGALLDATARMADGARVVRQFLSASTVRIVASLPVDAAIALAGLTKEGHDTDELDGLTGEALDRLSLSLAGFGGMVQDSLVRGPGWRFLEIGRRLERSLLVLGLVEAMLVELPADAEQPVYELLLAACESLVAYRRRHRSHVVLPTVAANLLADADNPRAVAFQLDELQRLLAGLPERAGVIAQRRVVGDARRALSVSLENGADVLNCVLTVRNGVLGVADALPRIWFRMSDVRSRRVRGGRRR